MYELKKNWTVFTNKFVETGPASYELFMIMPQLITNTYVSLTYELKKNWTVFTSKFVETGPASYIKKLISRAAVSQRFRTVALNTSKGTGNSQYVLCCG